MKIFPFVIFPVPTLLTFDTILLLELTDDYKLWHLGVNAINHATDGNVFLPGACGLFVVHFPAYYGRLPAMVLFEYLSLAKAVCGQLPLVYICTVIFPVPQFSFMPFDGALGLKGIPGRPGRTSFY
jgi:hypothetical protein